MPIGMQMVDAAPVPVKLSESDVQDEMAQLNLTKDKPKTENSTLDNHNETLTIIANEDGTIASTARNEVQDKPSNDYLDEIPN